MVLSFWQAARNHGFFLYLQGFILYTFPHFIGISPCGRMLELGTVGKVGFRHGAEARGGYSPGPSCFRTDLPGQHWLCHPTRGGDRRDPGPLPQGRVPARGRQDRGC